MTPDRDIRSALADVLGLIPAGHPLLCELLSVRDAAATAPQRWCWIKAENAVERHFGPNPPTVPWMVEMLRSWRAETQNQAAPPPPTRGVEGARRGGAVPSTPARAVRKVGRKCLSLRAAIMLYGMAKGARRR